MPIRDKVYDKLKSIGLTDSKEDFFKYYDNDENVRKQAYSKLRDAGLTDTEEDFYEYMKPQQTMAQQLNTQYSEEPYTHEYDENMNLVGGTAYEEPEPYQYKPEVQKYILQNKPDMFKPKTVDMYGAHSKDRTEMDMLQEGRLYDMKDARQNWLQRPITTFGESFEQGTDALYQGGKNLVGETANIITGSQRDYQRAKNQLDELVSSGYDLSNFDAEQALKAFKDRDYQRKMNEWQRNIDSRKAEREDMGFFESLLHKMQDPSRPKSQYEDTGMFADELQLARSYQAIQDALQRSNGNVQEAYKLLGQQASKETWGDKTTREARQALANQRPTEGFSAWVGGMIPQMIGTGAGIVASLNPYTRWLARPLGMTNMAFLTGATSGMSMAEARQYAEEKGLPINEGDVWRTGIVDAAIEYGTEKIPFNRYFGRVQDVTKKIIGKGVADAALNNDAVQNEVSDLLQRASKEFRNGLFTKENLKEYLKDVGTEGVSEFMSEALQTLSPIIYQNPEDYPTLTEVLNNGLEGAKGGLFMGAFLGGGSLYSANRMQNYANRKRRESQGAVSFIETDKGIFEVLGQKNGVYSVMDSNGEESEVTVDQVRDQVSVSLEDFDASMKEARESHIQDAVDSDNAEIDAATDPQTGMYGEVTMIDHDENGKQIDVTVNVYGEKVVNGRLYLLVEKDGKKDYIRPMQYYPESYQKRPAEEVKALNEEMIREEAAVQAERESKYAPEVLSQEMQQGIPFETEDAIYVPISPMLEGNGWVVEVQPKGVDNKAAARPFTEELTNDQFHDLLQAQLDAQEAAQAEAAKVEESNQSIVEGLESKPMEDGTGRMMQPKGVQGNEVVYDITDGNGTVLEEGSMDAAEYNGVGESVGEQVNAEEKAEVQPQKPTIPTKEDGSIDFVSYGKDNTFKALGERYGEKMPNKVAVTAKALAEDLKKAQKKLEKAEEAYDNAPIGREQKAEEARDKARQELEAIQKEADFWAEMDAEIKDSKAKREAVLNPQADVVTSTEPMSTDEFIAQQLAVGNIVLNKADYMAQTGYGTEEVKSLNGGTQKLITDNGMSLDAAGERLMEMDRENGTNFFNQDDATAGRDALIALLGSVRTRKELNQYIAENRKAQAKKESEAIRNASEEYVMSGGYESLEDYLDQMEAAEMEENPFRDIDVAQIDAIFVEAEEEYQNYINNEQGRTSEVVEGDNNVLPEEQADYTGGTSGVESEGYSERNGEGASEASESTHAATEVELKQEEGETPLQFAERAAEENRRRPLRKRAEEWSNTLGIKVTYLESIDDVDADTRREIEAAHAKGSSVPGWVDKNGEVFFFMPDLSDLKDVDDTYIHEVVAHVGLPQLLGKERFGELCDKVWEMMPQSAKDYYMSYPGVKNHRDAADEYIAHLAEQQNLTPEEKTIWDNIVKMFREMLDKALNGIIGKSKLTDEDISNLIKASYANLKSGAEGSVESSTRFKVYKSKDGEETKYKQLSLFGEGNEVIDDRTRPNNLQREGDSTIERLNHLRELQEGEICNVERKFTESKEFSFTRGEKVESTADVAYIFKSLEDEAVENSFVAITNGDNVSVFHLGMGAQTETVVDTSAILAAVDRLDADKVFFVHNHPSGMVKCSRQDILTYQKLKDRLGDKLQDGIIINTRSGKYGLFNSSGLVDDEGRIKEEKNEYPLKVYKFNKQSFNVDVIPTVEASSSGIAEFVSTQRLGKRDKVNALLLNNQFGCVGNILIDNSKNMSYVAERITNDAIAMGARQVVIYGRYPFVEVTDRKTNFASYLSSMINGFSQGNVNLIDIIQIDEPYSKSANDEGVRFRVKFTPEERTIIDKAKTDGSYMKAPNGKLTNLNEKQWAQVRTKAFKAWFGDWENNPNEASKVVDENGEPMVVRHRTPNEFNEFSKEKIGSSTDYGAFGMGFYFSPSDFGAWNYGYNMIEAFLNLKNPLVLNNSNAFDIKEPFYGEDYRWSKTESERFTEWVKENGYDGVHYDHDGKHDEMVAFEPNQIKSATDNVGTFDEGNNDIRFRFIGERGARNLDKAEEATTRLDNLNVAREMETAEKDAKTIKMATGWERGADGLWRYEVDDNIDFELRRPKRAELKKAYEEANEKYYKLEMRVPTRTPKNATEEEKQRIKELRKELAKLRKGMNKAFDAYYDYSAESATLGEFLGKDNQLFKEYPELADYDVSFLRDSKKLAEGLKGSFTPEYKVIWVDDARPKGDIKSTLVHEIQHAIQGIEGFAQGGTPAAFASAKYQAEEWKANFNKFINRYGFEDWSKNLPIEDWMKYGKEYKGQFGGLHRAFIDNAVEDEDVKKTLTKELYYVKAAYDKFYQIAGGMDPAYKFKDANEWYRSLSGEVESRNVQQRMGMTDEQRRNSLASETEDVAREDQIFLKDGIESGMRFRLSEKGKQIQAEVDKFTSKYNSKEVVLVDSEMTDEELEAAVPGESAEDLREALKNENCMGGYLPDTDKIYIFVDNQPTDDVEGTMFHENVHGMFHDNVIVDAFDKASDGAFKAAREEIAKLYAEKHRAEELFAYVVQKAMNEDDFKHIEKYLAGDYKETFYNKIKEFGYDTEEEIGRRAVGRRTGSDNQEVRTSRSEEQGASEEVVRKEESAKERKERLGKLLDQVADMGLEGVLGNKAYSSMMVDIYKAMPEDVRAEIADDAIRHYGGSVAPAVNDFIGPKSDGNFMDKVVTIVREALRKIGIGLDLNANEVRYMAWRSKKPLDRNSLMEVAEDIDMRFRLKVGEYEGSPTPDGGGTRFRESGKLNVRDEYEATIKKGGYQAREAVQDAMLSLRRFQELIEKASGKKIRDFENAWMHENRLSSVVQAEIHDMERKFYKPMIDAVKKVMKAANLEQEQVADYLMLKHGIERNREMAVRKALTDDKGKIDRSRLEQWYQEKEAIRNDASLDTWRKKQEAMDIAALNYGADMSRDYSGLTSMFGTDDLADSTQQAYDEVEALETAHPVETEALGKAIKAMTQNTLDESFGSGLMDRKVYDELSKDMYDYYIPLRGFEETTSDEVYAYLDQDRGAFNAPLKRAKGRSSKSDNPIAYLKSIAESGLMQGERNKMKQSFLNMVINHPSDLVSVREGVWVIFNPGTGEWEAAAPPTIPNNATPADIESIMEAWEQQMEQAAQNDPTLVKRVAEAADVPYRVVGNRMNQHQIIVKRLGKSYTLTINGNPRLAMALNGLTNPNNTSNDGKVAAFVNNKIGSINRSLAAWYTTRNPDFVASNFMRDTFYTNTIVRAKEGNKYANKFHKNYAMVLPQMLVLFGKYEKGTLNPANPTEAAFLDFMMNGGETGYSNLKDVEEIKKQIAKELKGSRFAKVEVLAEKLDILNRAVENTARFAAFLTSREVGRSIAKSIYDAKEISVNFNKKGAGGTFFGMTGQTWFGNLAAMVGASGRALYVFFNAAIQGSTNLMHVMKVNPIGTSAGLAAMFLMGAVVPFLFGDDDDEKGYYDLPEHVRRNHLIIPGAGDAWVSIPLPIEYRIMYGIGELLTSWRTGHERGTDIARKMLSMTGQALPLNFLEEGLEAFVPSAVSPIYQVMTNSSWTGLPIYKENDFNKDDPEYTKAYSNVDKNLLKFTKALYEWTFDEENQEEGIDLNPAIIETLAKGYFGGLATQLSNLAKVGGMIAGEQEFDWRNIPIGNRIFKTGDERTKEKRVNNEYFENMEKLDFLQSRERRLKKTINGEAVPQADKEKAKIDDEIMRGSEVFKKYQEFKKLKKKVDKIRKTIKEKGSTPEREKQLMEAQEAANKAVR